jgi:hypothetical protein
MTAAMSPPGHLKHRDGRGEAPGVERQCRRHPAPRPGVPSLDVVTLTGFDRDMGVRIGGTMDFEQRYSPTSTDDLLRLSELSGVGRAGAFVCARDDWDNVYFLSDYKNGEGRPIGREIYYAEPGEHGFVVAKDAESDARAGAQCIVDAVEERSREQGEARNLELLKLELRACFELSEDEFDNALAFVNEQLRQLHPQWPALRSKDLFRNPLTDKSVSALCASENVNTLEYLDIGFTKVTSRLINQLAEVELPVLRFLNLGHSKVDAQGYLKLAELAPKFPKLTRIEFHGYTDHDGVAAALDPWNREITIGYDDYFLGFGCHASRKPSVAS